MINLVSIPLTHTTKIYICSMLFEILRRLQITVNYAKMRNHKDSDLK
jgi:hypothetical protein